VEFYSFDSVLEKRLETAVVKFSHQLDSHRVFVNLSDTLGSQVNVLRDWLEMSRTSYVFQFTNLSIQQARDALSENKVSIYPG
jgi:hypothetical protein